MLCLPLLGLVNSRIKSTFKRIWISLIIFLGVYGIFSVTVIPFLARKFGRIPLPMGVAKNSRLVPLNILTCICNRHYVDPQLYQALRNVSNQLEEKYKGTIVCYLDGNFPFLNGFPLIPHLSHNDGKKIDLAFFYKNKETGKEVNKEAPSLIGYGVCEEPVGTEINMPQICETKGYWQYNLLKQLIPEPQSPTLYLDSKRTKELIVLLSAQSTIGKIFIEPHLKQRFKLQKYSSIRFHGCQAVRHDDHIHAQLK